MKGWRRWIRGGFSFKKVPFLIKSITNMSIQLSLYLLN
jgi:hypothetical protein